MKMLGDEEDLNSQVMLERRMNSLKLTEHIAPDRSKRKKKVRIANPYGLGHNASSSIPVQFATATMGVQQQLKAAH